MSGKPAQAFAALAMITALIAVPAGSAKATESDCDSFITGQFKIIGSGASFQAYGRSVNLLNDDTFNHSFTYISSGYQFGDLVWVDRSLNPMSSNVPTYFSDDSYVTSRGGWKQCGPTEDMASLQVVNWNTTTQEHFAARACFRPWDGRPSVCGKWYVDRT
ncbi:hypothetical protein IL992_42690 [Microbispora sp. NEAU-D428]|uniref:hypothetical protein n=1 Tax=Microbispora sitophila TaxID=2771537 RepID=UPI0018671F7B|nr:hypothetical protein [Microbispora sitophila]MBE3015827.1 hypothetical protein [Microbispora sitophila]